MRVLLTGASGQLGSWITHQWHGRNKLLGWSSPFSTGSPFPPVNLTDESATRSALADANPDVILHAAAISKPDAVRLDPSRGWRLNVDATGWLCNWCRENRKRLIFTSTDMVFDGSRGRYAEDDPPNPVVEYGRTKAAAEALVRAVPGGLVVRVSLLYGPSLNGRPTFFTNALNSLRRGESQAFFVDEYRTPLDYETAARSLIKMTCSNLAGIVHLGGAERLSRFSLFGRIAAALALNQELVRPGRLADAPSPEPRPVDVSLDTRRLVDHLPQLRRVTIEQAARSWGNVNSAERPA